VARNIAPALRALLANLIDYAGLFPPASLPLGRALAGYHHHSADRRAWMLGRFVIPVIQLPEVPANMTAPFAVLAGADHPAAETIESKQILTAPKPVYCETGAESLANELDVIKAAGCFAKIRTGGVTPDAVPSVETVTRFLSECGSRRLPFKATAGLHHPIRSSRPLTYEKDAPVAVVHGFINVFLAAAFLWQGERDIAPVIAETEPTAFRFDARAHWRDLSLSVDQVAEARAQFAHSFGSCSFEEPVSHLERFGWL
jgi:hypothetical protein